MRELILILILSQASVFAQKETNIWYFGGDLTTTPSSPGPGLDFNNGLEVLTDGSLVTTEPSASMCDSDGNLLFYTNGYLIWNSNHDTMLNGEGLFACISTTQGVIIVKQPENDTRYYVFTIGDCNENFLGNNIGLNYTIVDMSLDGGLGGVILGSKNISLTLNVTEKMVAVNHCNGIDKWLVVHEKNNNNFLSFLITTSGVQPAITSSAGATHTGVTGQMKLSPNGRKLAVAMTQQNRLQLFDFDNSTGVVSNTINLASNVGEYGVSFSPDNSKLYVTNPVQNPTWETKLMQYDVTSGIETIILNSRIEIYSTSVKLAINGLQLASDGKIYTPRINPRDSVAIIHEPNKDGLACNFEFNALSLDGRQGGFTLPSFNESYFDIDTLDFDFNDYACPNDTVYFELNNKTSYDSIAWDFGDGSTLEVNTHIAKHTYNFPGVYKVALFIIDKCVIDTITKEVNIQNTLSIDIDDQVICSNETVVVSVGNIENGDIEWSTGDTTSEVSITEAGNYSVKVSISCNIASAEFTVEERELCEALFFPNAFNSGNYGLYNPMIIGYDKYQYSIFDRFGKLIYNSDVSTSLWGGQYKDKTVSSGNYIYFFEGFLNGKFIQKRGNVLVVH